MRGSPLEVILKLKDGRGVFPTAPFPGGPDPSSVGETPGEVLEGVSRVIILLDLGPKLLKVTALPTEKGAG
eukprot:15183645-Alexandrium_andersonii.AAC.1